jgi:serine/threonine protein kinase
VDATLEIRNDAPPDLVQPAVEPAPEPVRPVAAAAAAVVVEHFGSYLLTKRITSGGMAECFVGAVEETGEEVFIKRVREEEKNRFTALQREAEIYQKLERRGCEHTPRVIDLARIQGFLVLVTERAQYDLDEYVRERDTLATNEVKNIVVELIEGLQELHQAEIVHRDLKPSNVLRCGTHWVLADFGIAKDRRGAEGGKTFRLAGTSGYAAPEQVLTGIEAHPAADVYALGKVMVFMLTKGTDIDRVVFRQWRRLIRYCTAEAADQRPSLSSVAALLGQIDE